MNTVMYMSFRVVIRSCVKPLAIISYLCVYLDSGVVDTKR
jgi:hypothetical protein